MRKQTVGKVVTYSCKYCNESIDMFRLINEIEQAPDCARCKEPMSIERNPKRTTKCFTPYYNHGLDQYFYSRSEEKQFAKKSGLVDITGAFKRGDGWGNARKGR